MTVATTETRANYTGDNIITQFSFSFKTLDDDHMYPYLDGVVQGSGFTVTRNADQDASPGGDVDFAVAPGDGVLVTLERIVPNTQEIDYTEYDPFPAETHETGLDLATMRSQQNADGLDRATVAPVTDDGTVDYTLPIAAALEFMRWNSDGDALEGINIADLSLYAVSAFAETLLDDADADEHWATLMATIDKAVAMSLLGAANLTGKNIFSDLISFSAGANIASAATIDLTAATGNSPRITGATATSAVTMNAGQWALVVANGAWPLTYHATTNKLNGGASYTCSAGDMVLYNKDLSGIVHGFIIKADGTSVVANPISSGTPIATTSGTSHDFTGIPSWAKRITLMFDGVSTSGTSNPIIQIGDSGGVETSGYDGSGSRLAAASVVTSNFTSGFGIRSASASNVLSGAIVLTLLDSSANTWVAQGIVAAETAITITFTLAGKKALSSILDRIRLTTVGGTETFDAGSINISYE